MAVWSTAYINDLPDSAFLYIAPGGEKDEQGKTVPRSLRYFPVRDASGKVDIPHLRNALARIPQSDLPQDVKERVRRKAEALAREYLTTYQEEEEEVIPLKITEIMESEGDGSINRYRVQLLEPDTVGKGANKRVYPSSMFARNYHLYEGAKAYLDHSYDRQKNRSVKDVVGYYENVAPDGSADLVVVNHRDLIHPLILEQQRSGKELVGLSHHILARSRPEKRGKETVNVVEEIADVRSVDLVTSPAVGGRVKEILEDEEVEMKTVEELKESYPELLAEYRQEVVEELREKIREETEGKVYGTKANQEKKRKELEKRFSELEEAIKDKEARIEELERDREAMRREQLVAEAVKKSGLPPAAGARIIGALEEAYESEEELVAAIDEAIKSEKSYIATIRDSGRTSRPGSSRDAATMVLEEARQVLGEMLGNTEQKDEKEGGGK
jgi:hypothetical protein